MCLQTINQESEDYKDPWTSFITTFTMGVLGESDPIGNFDRENEKISQVYLSNIFTY